MAGLSLLKLTYIQSGKNESRQIICKWYDSCILDYL